MARVRHKSKEEALDACAEQHLALVTCFKSCNLVSAFTGCCTAEHKAFWDCFTRERGTNETKITSYLNSVFGGGGGSGQIGGSATASAGQGLEAKGAAAQESPKPASEEAAPAQQQQQPAGSKERSRRWGWM